MSITDHLQGNMGSRGHKMDVTVTSVALTTALPNNMPRVEYKMSIPVWHTGYLYNNIMCTVISVMEL